MYSPGGSTKQRGGVKAPPHLKMGMHDEIFKIS